MLTIPTTDATIETRGDTNLLFKGDGWALEVRELDEGLGVRHELTLDVGERMSYQATISGRDAAEEIIESVLDEGPETFIENPKSTKVEGVVVLPKEVL